jgi:hypothetical protein
MKTLYRAGYLIRVTSWENDGDNYNTKEIQVDTEQEARDVVAFCDMFGSNSPSEHDIGNLCDGEGNEARPAFRAFYFSHPGFVNLTLSDYEDEEEETDAICDAMMEVAYDLGLSGGEYFYTRVSESVTVYRIPADVLVEQVQFK